MDKDCVSEGVDAAGEALLLYSSSWRYFARFLVPSVHVLSKPRLIHLWQGRAVWNNMSCYPRIAKRTYSHRKSNVPWIQTRDQESIVSSKNIKRVQCVFQHTFWQWEHALVAFFLRGFVVVWSWFIFAGITTSTTAVLVRSKWLTWDWILPAAAEISMICRIHLLLSFYPIINPTL